MKDANLNEAPQSVDCREGDSVSKVSTANNPFAVPRGLRLYIVKARRTGSSIVLTCPYADIGDYYHVSVDGRGVITYTPVALAVQERDE